MVAGLEADEDQLVRGVGAADFQEFLNGLDGLGLESLFPCVSVADLFRRV